MVQKVAVKHEFESGPRNTMTVKLCKTLSINPALNGYLSRIREG